MPRENSQDTHVATTNRTVQSLPTLAAQLHVQPCVHISYAHALSRIPRAPHKYSGKKIEGQRFNCRSQRQQGGIAVAVAQQSGAPLHLPHYRSVAVCVFRSGDYYGGVIIMEMKKMTLLELRVLFPFYTLRIACIITILHSQNCVYYYHFTLLELRVLLSFLENIF